MVWQMSANDNRDQIIQYIWCPYLKFPDNNSMCLGESLSVEDSVYPDLPI